MQRCPRNVKCVGTTWGISSDVCHICILCSSVGTLTTIAKLDSLELTMGMSATATDYTYALYNRQTFLFVRIGEERIRPTYCMICICMCINELNLEKEIETNINQLQIRKS
jgi:hypothetical protein